jgi:hypothetical protein
MIDRYYYDPFVERDTESMAKATQDWSENKARQLEESMRHNQAMEEMAKERLQWEKERMSQKYEIELQ